MLCGGQTVSGQSQTTGFSVLMFCYVYSSVHMFGDDLQEPVISQYWAPVERAGDTSSQWSLCYDLVQN